MVNDATKRTWTRRRCTDDAGSFLWCDIRRMIILEWKRSNERYWFHPSLDHQVVEHKIILNRASARWVPFMGIYGEPCRYESIVNGLPRRATSLYAYNIAVLNIRLDFSLLTSFLTSNIFFSLLLPFRCPFLVFVQSQVLTKIFKDINFRWSCHKNIYLICQNLILEYQKMVKFALRKLIFSSFSVFVFRFCNNII